MTAKEENINLELVTERFNLPQAIVSWNTPLGSLWVSSSSLIPGKKDKIVTKNDTSYFRHFSWMLKLPALSNKARLVKINKNPWNTSLHCND